MTNFAFKIFLFASLIVFFCTINANAQMCGKFKETVVVQDEIGKPVETAVVQFLPITKDETLGKQFTRSETDRSVFEIEYPEGHSVREFHRLVVSADGYKTAENEMTFYSCERRRIIIKLPKTDSAASPVWEIENNIQIITKDENNKNLNGAKVSVLRDGKILKSKNSKFDRIGFSLKSGVYIFRLEKDGYQTEDIKVDLTKIAQVNITVNLKSKK